MRTNSHPKRPASPLPNQSPFIESLYAPQLGLRLRAPRGA